MSSSNRIARWGRRLGAGSLSLVALVGVLTYVTTDGLDAFGAAPSTDSLEIMRQNPHYDADEGKFVNVIPTGTVPPSKMFDVLKNFVFNDAQVVPPSDLPMDTNTAELLATPPETGLRVTWVGHSTILVEIDGARILTDPVWGERASPSTIVGPSRFQPAALTLEEVGRIDAVVISHDHYDHLDMHTIKRMAGKPIDFYAPLGVRAHLEAWGVSPARIKEVEWWDEFEVPGGSGVKLVATPCRHFSGRGPTNRDSTLWTSWAFIGPTHRAYFSGDSGMTPQFDEIGERLGPFDLGMMETGAYHENWGDIHLGPDQAIAASKMIKAKKVMPIHWGTFQLAPHAWSQPVERLTELAQADSIPLVTPRLGQPVEPGAGDAFDPWWRDVR